MRTPMTRPRNRSSDVRNKITDIGTMPRLWANPASISAGIPAIASGSQREDNNSGTK